MNPTIVIFKPQLSIAVLSTGLGVAVKAREVKPEPAKRPRN